MLDQAFSPSCLLRLVKPEDVARFRLWRPGDDQDAIMAGIAAEINDPAFSFPDFQEKIMRGKTIYSAPDAVTILALRKLDRNIRAIYKVKQANRDAMVHQVKSLLREGCSFTVLRLDISSFYESIDRTKLLDKIARDSIVSYTSRSIFKKIFKSTQFDYLSGLPRGLGVSATLAELYVRSLDQKIQALKHVYFYGRYVDDMVVFTHAPGEEVVEEIKRVLDSLGLKLNPDKKEIIECSRDKNLNDEKLKCFDFLGYRFGCNMFLTKEGDWRNVAVRIATSKMKKIKSRIAHSFISYSAVPDFQLLLKRLRFLTDSHTLRKGIDGGLKGGIYYNYNHIDNVKDLIELDSFLIRLIFSKKGSIGKKLGPQLNAIQRRKLVKLSFRAAFEGRFSQGRLWGSMKEIRNGWIYEKN